MRPSRLTGLVVGVAILTGIATWSVSQVATDSHSGTPKSDVVSTSGTATNAYVDGVVALNPEQRAAVYGNVGLRTPYIGSVNALSPESQMELQRAANLAATADWARAEGLTGLSPASLKPIAAPDSGVADWARAEGLTGLSPASLTPTLHEPSVRSVNALSPELQAIDTSPAEQYADALAALPRAQLVAMFGNFG
jgi:hypothetical protein